jgi:hypothetical protein
MKPFASTARTQRAEVDDRISVPDHRRSPRKKVLKGGRTVWQSGHSTECIVHRFSEIGAHLEIRGPVPKTIDLVIDGISRAVRAA